MTQKKYINPFYFLLLFVGIAFAITACAYGVMTVNMLDGDEAFKIRESKEGLLYWMDQNGFQLLMIELIVLGVATFGAIGTDDFWRKLAKVDEPAAGTAGRSPEKESAPEKESGSSEGTNDDQDEASDDSQADA